MIGIFDSGSGGLTVLRAIRERLPSSDILYFGDIKHAPYGMRSHEDISALTAEAMRFLATRDARSIVSACNSASASLALSLLDAFSLETDSLIEMVGPTVSMFRGSDARVVLFATKATVDAGIYQSGFKMIGKEISCIAIPDLAGAIEAGIAPAAIEQIVINACAAVDWASFDVAILACTHYPLVFDAFRAAIPERVGIFDPADAVAERVERKFWPREAGDGKLHFVISQDSDTFRTHVARMFPDTQYTIEVIE
jgi:glutamate racemase